MHATCRRAPGLTQMAIRERLLTYNLPWLRTPPPEKEEDYDKDRYDVVKQLRETDVAMSWSDRDVAHP